MSWTGPGDWHHMLLAINRGAHVSILLLSDTFRVSLFRYGYET